MCLPLQDPPDISDVCSGGPVAPRSTCARVEALIPSDGHLICQGLMPHVWHSRALCTYPAVSPLGGEASAASARLPVAGVWAIGASNAVTHSRMVRGVVSCVWIARQPSVCGHSLWNTFRRCYGWSVQIHPRILKHADTRCMVSQAYPMRCLRI